MVRTSLPSAVTPSTSSADTNHVTGTADGVDQWFVETLVDLRAQPGHVHVDHVGLGIEMIIPDVLEQHRARHHLVCILHEIFEKPEFTGLQEISCPERVTRWESRSSSRSAIR